MVLRSISNRLVWNFNYKLFSWTFQTVEISERIGDKQKKLRSHNQICKIGYMACCTSSLLGRGNKNIWESCHLTIQILVKPSKGINSE